MSDSYRGFRDEHDDPLDHADLGETVEVETSQVIKLGGDRQPRAFWNDEDRFAAGEPVNAEVVEIDGKPAIEVQWEGSQTKRLPYRWDYAQEPRTDQEAREQARRERREKWLGRVGRAAQILVPAALSVGIATQVINAMASETMINGEPIGAPGIGPIAFVFVLVVFIMWAVQYAPRTIRGGRHA